MRLFFNTNTRILEVSKTGDESKPLLLMNRVVKGNILATPSEYDNAGQLIKDNGGVENFLSLCFGEDEFEKRLESIRYASSPERLAVLEQRKAEREEKMKAEREKEYLDLLGEKGYIETTYENIGIVLRYLNCRNWGSWELPKMTIGFRCNQYDCDGKTASTMILDTPIDVYGDKESMFVVGAPVGHLMKYRRC